MGFVTAKSEDDSDISEEADDSDGSNDNSGNENSGNDNSGNDNGTGTGNEGSNVNTARSSLGEVESSMLEAIPSNSMHHSSRVWDKARCDGLVRSQTQGVLKMNYWFMLLSLIDVSDVGSGWHPTIIQSSGR